jgi:major inositol transporter-like SP family MFS transporter
VPWIRKVVLIGIGIAIVQQISGVNTIMYYGTQILTDAGFSANGALIANIGVISVLATFVGIYLLGKIDRRRMLMAGQIGTTSALLLIGLFSLALTQGTGRAFVVLALTVTFLAFQQGATSPVTWLMLAEIFPLKLRGFGLGLAGLTLWLTNFVVELTFPMLVAALNISNTFFVFVVLGVLAILFVKRFIPETRGRSLEVLEAELHAKYSLDGGTTRRRSWWRRPSPKKEPLRSRPRSAKRGCAKPALSSRTCGSARSTLRPFRVTSIRKWWSGGQGWTWRTTWLNSSTNRRTSRCW